MTEYVKKWAIISAERKDITEIVFIDCMCNAGVYKDGDFCTSIEILLVFNECAKQHNDKLFKLYLNDIDNGKLDVLNSVLSTIKIPSNVKVYIDNLDVNVYLNKIASNNSIFGYGKSVVLYVDPYNFGTVNISAMQNVLKNNYCELIYNFFISDYVRNWSNAKDKIIHCLGRNDIDTKDKLISYMKEQLKIGNMKYYFSYQFKTTNNVELYQIVFVTPNLRGLEVLKDTLWEVFDGEFAHRNKPKNEYVQTCLFSDDDKKDWRLEAYSEEAKNQVLSYKGQTLTFKQIETMLIEDSMLKESQILNYVIKPLIADNKLSKLNMVKTKSNYKKDSYLVL